MSTPKKSVSKKPKPAALDVERGYPTGGADRPAYAISRRWDEIGGPLNVVGLAERYCKSDKTVTVRMSFGPDDLMDRFLAFKRAKAWLIPPSLNARNLGASHFRYKMLDFVPCTFHQEQGGFLYAIVEVVMSLRDEDALVDTLLAVRAGTGK